ncbi:8238_t:CDS:10, partial [Funneliformis caledonium]
LAVGKEIFTPNAEEFITLLAQTQQSVTEPDDPQISYLIASWARVCKVLGEEFVPYLPIVMPPLLQSAQLKPDFAILDPDDDIESKYSADDGWEFVGVEGQQIGIKTTVLEEKCTAVEMLICYARELGSSFQPYVDSVLEIVLPLLKFCFHEGIRNAAAATIPHLLNSVKKANANQDYVLNMWHTIAKKIIEAIMGGPDPSFLWQLYITFYESLETVGDNSLDTSLLEAFTNATEAQLQEFYQRLKQREQARHSGDYDAEDEDIIAEEEATEEGVLGELSKAIHVVLKTHRTSYLLSFDKLLPIVTTFLADANPAARQWALCVIDDVVEFTGPASWNYHTHFLEKMIASLLDIASDVRQAAAYGIGVCAQFGGENYADAVAAALTPLFQVINSEGSRKDENVYATENAISAISKILKYNHSKFDVNAVIPAWFASLPILYDEEEAAQTYTYLLDLLESQHPAILGNNNENIPRIISIFAEVLAAAILPETVSTRMVSAVKVILSSLSDDVKASLWNSIDPENRKALQIKNEIDETLRLRNKKTPDQEGMIEKHEKVEQKEVKKETPLTPKEQAKYPWIQTILILTGCIALAYMFLPSMTSQYPFEELANSTTQLVEDIIKVDLPSSGTVMDGTVSSRRFANIVEDSPAFKETGPSIASLLRKFSDKIMDAGIALEDMYRKGDMLFWVLNNEISEMMKKLNPSLFDSFFDKEDEAFFKSRIQEMINNIEEFRRKVTDARKAIVDAEEYRGPAEKKVRQGIAEAMKFIHRGPNIHEYRLKLNEEEYYLEKIDDDKAIDVLNARDELKHAENVLKVLEKSHEALDLINKILLSYRNKLYDVEAQLDKTKKSKITKKDLGKLEKLVDMLKDSQQKFIGKDTLGDKDSTKIYT